MTTASRTNPPGPASSKGASKAIADLEKAVQADAKDTRALLRLAELQAKGGQEAQACETYERAGEVFIAQGFGRRALSALALALEVARKNGLVARVAPIARAMARLYGQEKLPREATATLDAAVRHLIEKGRDADAVALLEERIALEDAEIARVRLAEAFFRLGQPARAASQLQRVFARLYGQNRRDEALDVAERLLGERRDIPVARAAAEMYLARNRPGDPFLALAKLRVCCAADPTHVPTLRLLTRAFELSGHAEKAARVQGEIDRMTGRVKLARRVVAQTSRAREESLALKVDAGWDEERDEARDEAPAAPISSASPVSSSPPIDPGRASFWPVDERPAPDKSGSVVSVSLAELELFEGAEGDDGPPPAGASSDVSVFDAALECIESLIAQGRNDEALALVARHLELRPRNALLLERREEIEEMKRATTEGPPAALYGFKRPASHVGVVAVAGTRRAAGS
jgi:tetratricopeptide (TPR) repeat protein